MENLVNWSKSYELGISIIDSQHKKIFGLANELHKTDVKGANKVALDLFRYTRYHFNSEEKLLGIYPEYNLERHRELHSNLISRLSDLTEGGIVSNSQRDDLLKFLLNWLENHILKEDLMVSQKTNDPL